jgi:hypothetical protein
MRAICLILSAILLLLSACTPGSELTPPLDLAAELDGEYIYAKIDSMGTTVELEDSSDLADLLDILISLKFEPKQVNRERGVMGGVSAIITLLDEDRNLTQITLPEYVHDGYGYGLISDASELDRRFTRRVDYGKYTPLSLVPADDGFIVDMAELPADEIYRVVVTDFESYYNIENDDRAGIERVLNSLKKIKFTPADSDSSVWEECTLVITFDIRNGVYKMLTLPLHDSGGELYEYGGDIEVLLEELSGK